MKRLLAVLFLAVGVLIAQVSVGIHIGPMPRARIEIQTHRPNDRSIWIAGHWDVVNNHYVWHHGYWTTPPYEGAIWYAPTHDGQMYHDGYWNGNKGRVEHNHNEGNKRRH